MTDATGRAPLLAVGIAVAVAGFALDGALVRLVALAGIGLVVLVLDGRELPRNRHFFPPLVGLGLALMFGLSVGLPKVGPQLVFHAALAAAGLVFGFVLQRQPVSRVLSVARGVLLFYLGVVVLQIFRGQVTLTGLSLPGASGSSNLVSGLLLFLQLFHCAAEFSVSGRAPIVLPFVSAVLSVPMKGRSGIALLTALFLVCLVQRWMLHRIARKVATAGMAAAVVGIVALLFREPLTAVFQTTRLIHGFGDESRGMMREQYLSGLSPLDVVIGGSFDPSPAILTLLGNPHNSFVRAHYFFGLPFFLLLATLTVAALASLVRAPHKRWFPFALMLFFLARAFVDVVAFPGLLDFVFYYLLFLVLALPASGERPRVPVPHATGYSHS